MHDYLVAPKEVQDITTTFLDQRALLTARVLGADAEHDSISLAGDLANITDRLILEIWNHAADDIVRDNSVLYALGGYGRRELTFGSDIDLVIEMRDESMLDHLELHASVERFMAWCRDARIKLSHAVRTPEQALSALDLDDRTAISLIDSRPLRPEFTADWQTVDARVAIEFLRGQDKGIDFIERLVEGYRDRLARNGQTVYLLEPDLKNGEGGLRDLNCIHWAAAVRWRFAPLIRLCPEQGWIQEHQETYRHGLEWLLHLRNLLHLTHNRKHDRLNFVDQEKLAAQLYGARGGAATSTVNSAAELLMREHYKIARAISTMTERFLRLWGHVEQDINRPVGTCFEQVDGQIGFHGPALPGADLHSMDLHGTDAPALFTPHQLLEALELASQYDALLDPVLELHIAGQVEGWGEAERADRGLNQQFLHLLTGPTTSPRTSHRLLDLNILPRLIPEFEPIVCHVQHDVYHVYTTDVHSLKCLEMARALVVSRQDIAAQKWPFFQVVAHEVVDTQTLLLAALFHDIGKNRGGSHSQRGAEMMSAIGERLGLRGHQIDGLAFLVREHLTLSHTARRRDISDQRVIRDIAARLRTVETLNQLTTLTFCDMSTVGPNVMTDWNATLLTELYRRLRTALEHGVESTWKGSQVQVDRQRDTVLSLWKEAVANGHIQDNVTAPGEGGGKLLNRLDEFIRDIPTEHFLATAPEALLRQFQVYDSGTFEGGTAILCTPIVERGVTEIIVSTQDVPGTLAKICGVFSISGLNILTASIVTTTSNRTLDIFLVNQSPPSSALLAAVEPSPLIEPRRIERLEERLLSVLSGEHTVEELLEKRHGETRLAARPTPSVETQVSAHQDLSDAFTVIEIKAPDQLGLLYRITRTLWLHGVSTHLSKIDSLGTQVIDTFYVEAQQGGKLDPEKTNALVEALIEAIESSPFGPNGG